MPVFLGQGTLLEKDKDGMGDWRVIAKCKSISGPSFEADEIDVTTHDSAGGFREFIRGLVDPGEISAECVFDPTDASHAEVDGVIADLLSGTIFGYRIQWVDAGRELQFSAFVKSFPITSPVDAELTATVTLRVTSNIVLANI